MADDVVGLRYVSEGLPEMLREIRTYQSALSNTARAETQRSTVSQRASRSADTEARRAYQNYLRYQREKAAAASRTAAQQAAAAQRAAQAERQLAMEQDRLISKYNPAAAAARQYERALEEINRAQAIGVINAQQHRAAIRTLGTEFQAFQNGTAGWSNQFVTGATRSARSVNRMGMVTQQVGYQVGDFLVQVQSGTNAFVAFGQQATQLAGLIGLVNPALVGIGAALGIVIPLVTAFGAFWLRTRQAAESAARGIDDLEESLKSLDGTLRDWMATKRAAELGVTAEELLGIEGMENAERQLASAREELERLQRVAEALRNMPASPESAVMNLIAGRSARGAAEEELAALEAVIAAENRLAQLRQMQSEAQFAAFSEQRVELEEQLALAQTIAQFGAESAEVRRLEAEQRLAAFQREIDLQVRQNELTEAQGAALVRQRAEIIQIEKATAEINLAQDAVKAGAEVLETIWGNLKDLVTKAADEAARFGENLILGEGYLSNAVRAGVASGAIPPQAVRDLPQTEGNRAQAELLENRRRAYRERIRDAEREAEREARKGQTEAGRNAREAAREAERLREEIEKLNFDADPLAKYNHELERLKELREAGLSDRAYANEIKRLNEELKKAAPHLVSFSSKFKDVFGDAFKDMLNGTIKSFKDFGKRIMSDLKRLLTDMARTALRNHIIIPLTAAFTGSGGMANAASGLLGGGGGGGGLFSGVGGLAGLGSAFTGGMSFFSSAVGSGFASGGIGGALSGGWTAITTALSGATGGLGGIAAAAGALAVPLAGVGLLIGAFTKKTKELDNGLRVTVDGLDASVDTFRKIETSRFFGLSRSRSTSFRNDPDNPLIGTVNSMQNSIMEAARVLGVGASAFDDFSYKFKVSLKGLTEEQKIAKINEELAKMGDAFTSLGTGIETMDELLRKAAEITASVKALTDTQDLFVTRAEAVFAASGAGFSNTIDSTDPEVQTLLRELIVAVREGDINNARLTSRILELQERQDLEPTT